ncbi:MAG TPA: aldose 1-epimerase [Parasegetibacter sp.]
MRFSITNQHKNGLNQIILADTVSRTEVVVLPQTGALLNAFSVIHGNERINIIDGYTDKNDLQNGLSDSFKGPKLSPFVCRMKDGRYEFGGKRFELRNKFKDGNAIHGLLYNKTFEEVKRFDSENEARLELEYIYDKDDEAYPFKYSCKVVYTLGLESRLNIYTQIMNLSDQTIPLADGWHPYFTLGGYVNDWELQFPCDGMVEFDDRLIPTGSVIPFNRFNQKNKIGDIELDNCFLLKQTNNKQFQEICLLTNPSAGLGIRFEGDGTYPYLQVYIPAHRKSIAIENLSGAPDCFNNKMGLILLPPGNLKDFSVSYCVIKNLS